MKPLIFCLILLSASSFASSNPAGQDKPKAPLITAEVGGKVSVANLCSKYERVFFTCETKTHKLISLCADPEISDSSGYLQYRYGTKKKSELEFPKELDGSLEKFFYAHYFRAQTDYTTLSFKIQKVRYAVFDNYDGTSQPSSTAGVTVKTGKAANEVSILCQSKPYSKLSELSELISCDPDDPLNMGTCK
jgi:hypothetical protein